MPNVKPLTRDELAGMHQKRLFFIIHKRTISTSGESFSVSNPAAAGEADLVYKPLVYIGLVGVGTFPPPIKDGSVVVDLDKSMFLNLFNNKSDGESWYLECIHPVKKEGFLSRLLGR